MEQPDNIIAFSDLSESVARTKLREIAKDSSKVFFTDHARKRMKQRKITNRQIICCMEHGQFDEGPYRETNGSWKMKLSVISAGDVISVVLVLDWDDVTKDHSIVITVIRG
ncbi:DUF4258 domain-containing protein [Acinetobacter soli]|uniref:DUF4258 domain-containing protein n=1 Tax=Acinetobacter soli TaxID=487316 RepID=UPI001F16F709|nr:DUF4258 domain-containing protein [Acinetobacter soli]MCE6007570.1 DUF4258 domain-containing protein [Acinetobacter soli]MDN8449650.1 DUF4258 domain-containing protein [Acinetobacter baumannii]